MAGTTGLEPATSAVTGQRSNQTELRPQIEIWTLRDHRRTLKGNQGVAATSLSVSEESRFPENPISEFQ